MTPQKSWRARMIRKKAVSERAKCPSANYQMVGKTFPYRITEGLLVRTKPLARRTLPRG